VGDVEGLFFGADGGDDDDEIPVTHEAHIPRLAGREVKRDRPDRVINPQKRAT
jgi:hypothetical protein